MSYPTFFERGTGKIGGGGCQNGGRAGGRQKDGKMKNAEPYIARPFDEKVQGARLGPVSPGAKKWIFFRSAWRVRSVSVCRPGWASSLATTWSFRVVWT